MGGLGAVGVSSLFGLVHGTGAFVVVVPTFVLFQEYISLNDTVTIPLHSSQRLLRDVRQWSVVS